MNRKPNILAAFLVLALAFLLAACSAGGDRVERSAEVAPGSGENMLCKGRGSSLIVRTWKYGS